jgi:glutamate-ammonia-ligase adenylyltransferase
VTGLGDLITALPRPFQTVTPHGGPGGALLDAVAGCSPYLAGLIAGERDWLDTALLADPASVIAALTGGLAADTPELGAALRQAKRRGHLYVALADCGGVWDLGQVTGALTALADRAVALALDEAIAAEVRRGRLPDDPGAVVFAMGKHGAGELNYSSDIDLIVLFDETRHPGTESEARGALVRAVRRMCATLSDVREGGYVFRTDLRLRPDASVTPVCLSMAAAESYYEAEGRTWERAAWIKARPVAGDMAAGARFLKTMVPFVWRRHLDFAAIRDAHDMRLRIRDHRRLHGIGVEGQDLKLGPGGIREIEFFTQTRQLIAGGRDGNLRDPTTLGGLDRLAAAGWIPGDVAVELAAAYADLRRIEHRLQMVNDAQTHAMPATAEGVRRIAAFLGEDEGAFRDRLTGLLGRVDGITAGFFAPGPAAPAPALAPEAEAIVAAWPRYPALRSGRAQELFARLRPALFERLGRAEDPQGALVALDGFLARLPAGVQLFSLFAANPALVDLIVDIAATAPALARHLAGHAEVLDAVIAGHFFADWPGEARLSQELGQRLAAADGHEARLDAARRWQHDWHFRVGVHHLRGLIRWDEAARQYADLAGATVGALWPVVEAEAARKLGPPPGRAVVVGMGSLGMGRLSAGSDLDLIVIYDAEAMAAARWYARATQGLIAALQAPTAAGRLYAVDMRLRPSGRQGPVAVSWSAFRSYQEDEAWTWEHVALTRARVVGGDAGLGADFEAFRAGLLSAKGKGAGVAADIGAMRARLLAARAPAGDWEARNGPGRLVDIDLAAQGLALLAGSTARDPVGQMAAGAVAGVVGPGDVQALSDARDLFARLKAAQSLLQAGADPAGLAEGGRTFVLRETGFSTAAALTRALDGASHDAAHRIDRVFGRGDADG